MNIRVFFQDGAGRSSNRCQWIPARLQPTRIEPPRLVKPGLVTPGVRLAGSNTPEEAEPAPIHVSLPLNLQRALHALVPLGQHRSAEQPFVLLNSHKLPIAQGLLSYRKSARSAAIQSEKWVIQLNTTLGQRYELYIEPKNSQLHAIYKNDHYHPSRDEQIASLMALSGLLQQFELCLQPLR